MIDQNLSNLKWALSKNEKNFLPKLFETYKDDPQYLYSLDRLMAFLKKHGCKNVEDRLRYIKVIRNFESALSELEIAKILIENGKTVEILPETYQGMKRPPDLLANDSNFGAYIEVTRITDDCTIELIISFLNKLIKNRGLPFAIDVSLNEEISVPAFGDERDIKKEKIKMGLCELKDKLQKIENDEIIQNICTSIGVFLVRRSQLELGYVGAFSLGSGFPVPKIIEKIRKDVINKAEKRTHWKGEHLKKYYVVALDFEHLSFTSEINDAILKSALFGRYNLCDADIKEMVEEANQKGWRSYLQSLNISSFDPRRRGIFFTEEISKNVSGVIGKFRGREIVFIPNPFAYNEINNPKLLNYL